MAEMSEFEARLHELPIVLQRVVERIGPGETVINQTELADEFGVRRETMNIYLRRLVHEGVLGFKKRYYDVGTKGGRRENVYWREDGS
jgi:predicted transcriptional regulator